jgi:hypothetical protein
MGQRLGIVLADGVGLSAAKLENWQLPVFLFYDSIVRIVGIWHRQKTLKYPPI